MLDNHKTCSKQGLDSIIKFNPSLAAAGWRLSPTHGWSCDQVCSAEGLSCSEAEQHIHNANVSTESGMTKILNKFGKRCSKYNLGWRTAEGVPLLSSDGTCLISTMSRTASQYNCTRNTDGRSKSRLCWCDISGLLYSKPSERSKRGLKVKGVWILFFACYRLPYGWANLPQTCKVSSGQ